MNEKIDLRVIKTKKAIHDAFLLLIKTKEYEKITVQDIAKEAMINRNTFYLHYVDKFDLMEQTWKYYFDKLNVCLVEYGEQPPVLDKQLFQTLLKTMLNTIDENIEFFYTMAVHNTQTQFTTQLKQSFYDFNLKQRKGKMMSKESQIRFEYMLSGMVGVVMLWILEHETMTVDNIVQQLVEIHFENDIRIE
ncbi:MAG: TetR/AcrR family transcriptional regulator [Culicoidibacterales bacterium]